MFETLDGPVPKGCLVLVQIALVRVLKTVLGHQRSSLDTVGNKVLAEVQNALRQLCGALVAVLVAIA
jgi:hypothetical protein